MTDVADRPTSAAPSSALWHGCTTARPTYRLRRPAPDRASSSPGVVILVSILSLFVRGLNLGIDFEGGVAWEVPRQRLTSRRRSTASCGATASTSPTPRSRRCRRRRRDPADPGRRPAGRRADARSARPCAKAAGSNPSDGQRQLGQRHLGREITRRPVRALDRLLRRWSRSTSRSASSGAWRSAAHRRRDPRHLHQRRRLLDLRFEVTPATVVAFLTILGFSLYDTIVVFDKVHENTQALRRRGARPTPRSSTCR